MTITIREVKSDKDLNKFIQFQNKLYRSNPFFVPPLHSGEKETLSPDKNPVFEFCEAKYWLALKNGNLVGRIACIINNRVNEKTNLKHARFSWFDVVESFEVAEKLFKTAESWALKNGMEAIYGPYGFTNFDKHGILVEGYNELATSSSNYNHPYYQDYIERLGYNKKLDWVEYSISVPDQIPEKMAKIAQLIRDRYELKIIRKKSKKELFEYKEDVFRLINAAYAQLFGTVAFNDKQINQFANKYFRLLNPEFVSMITDKDGKLIAFGITLPSISKALQKARGKLLPTGFIHLLRALKNNDTIDLLLIAVDPDYQNKGVNSLLFYDLIPNFQKHGIKYVETTQNQDDNVKVQAQWKYFDSRLHKRSRCYIKEF